MFEFFDMNGFGGYIWTSYGFAFTILGWLNYATWRKVKNSAEQLANLQATTSVSLKNNEQKNSDYKNTG